MTFRIPCEKYNPLNPDGFYFNQEFLRELKNLKIVCSYGLDLKTNVHYVIIEEGFDLNRFVKTSKWNLFKIRFIPKG